MHTKLICSQTGEEYAIDRLQNLSSAGKPLLARYDLPALKSRFTPGSVRKRPLRSMWRFWDVMPVDAPSEAVTLGEGQTPLLPCERRGPFAAFERLLIKDESFNPTGSFKARGMSAAVTRAVALGAKAVALPSAGNAAGAATYYAAKAGIECFLFMPEDTPPANIIESVVGGAHVFLVNGLISDCGKIVRHGCERFGWFDLSTLKEPFRVEGKKTMGYELAFDLADLAGESELRLPDVIFYPTGGGTGLIGMWKAFDEMERLGWIDSRRPRMVAVQAEGCAPVVKAFHEGADHAEMFPNARTVASGLRVPAAVGDFLMLRALRESKGTAISVTDEELMEGVGELSRFQGVYACPEGGAVWKAAEKLLAAGWLKPEEQIVLFNTGTGLKYNHLSRIGDLPQVDHTDAGCLDRVAELID
ncbi:MAG: threonine synthase [Planctomycetota bacterium]|nr:MAG: threonine synthase [Planctomycetota bacterium]REJ92623.1 MAG: threonine synthase [Planctomycetota bacterium]REK26748.1 MAG: threonine synthase [Planctomycetota bacterium]REK28325.1 MAG: threonine synthase [Planctomycetota bacterium]